VFLVGFLLNLFQDPVLDALGLGDTQASQAGAARWFSFSQSLLSGLAAGTISYAVLRRTRRRLDGADLAWPFYGLAGAGPGLLLVIGEGLTRTAGARVLELAGKVSELELVVQQMLSGARFNSALIVLFVGAISAVIAVGRTIGRPAAAEPGNTAAEPGNTAAEPGNTGPEAGDASPEAGDASPEAGDASPEANGDGELKASSEKAEAEPVAAAEPSRSARAGKD
jgi:iron complex transport system permease protein